MSESSFGETAMNKQNKNIFSNRAYMQGQKSQDYRQTK